MDKEQIPRSVAIVPTDPLRTALWYSRRSFKTSRKLWTLHTNT